MSTRTVRIINTGFVILLIGSLASISISEMLKAFIIILGLVSLGKLKLIPNVSLHLIVVTFPLFLFMIWVLSILAFGHNEIYLDGKAGYNIFAQLLLLPMGFFLSSSLKREDSTRTLLTVALLSILSLLSIIVHKGHDTTGFLEHKVRYAHALSIMMAMILVYLLFYDSKLSTFSKKGPFKFSLLIIACTLLIVFDSFFNKSRSLIISWIIVLALIFFLRWGFKKIFIFIPLLLGILILISLVGPFSNKIKRDTKLQVNIKHKIDFQKSENQMGIVFYNNEKTQYSVESLHRYNDGLVKKIAISDLTKQKENQTILNFSGFQDAIYQIRLIVHIHTIQEVWLVRFNKIGDSQLLLLSKERVTESSNMTFLERFQYFKELNIPLVVNFSILEDLRRDIWLSSISVIKSFPLLGVGPGKWKHFVYDSKYNPYLDQNLGIRLNRYNEIHWHAHNNFLNTAVEFGLPFAIVIHVFLLFITLIMILKFRYLVKNKAIPYHLWELRFFISFVALFSMGIFDFTLYSGYAGNLLWLFLGLSLPVILPLNKTNRGKI